MRTFLGILLTTAALAACDDAQPAADPDDAGRDARAADAAPDDAAPADAALDAGPADAALDAGPFDCAAAWRDPLITVDAAPLPAGSVAMTIDLDYGLRDGRGYLTLRALRADGVARPSDGPFSVDENAGHWAELRDADDATLYTRGVFQLIVESLEAPPVGDSGFARVDVCPDAGSIRLGDLPNDPRATQLVLFQDAIDGTFGGPTVEIARFPLPR